MVENKDIIELLEKLLEIHYGEEPGNLFGNDLVRRIKEMIISISVDNGNCAAGGNKKGKIL